MSIRPVSAVTIVLGNIASAYKFTGSGFASANLVPPSLREAVSLGLASPCIMCLVLPQSETDYFCGRDCKEEAMNKSFEE
jgi:hypothetical protein